MDIAGILIGGLAGGMMYFIVSVGLSVTMGLMGFINLAHGGFAMVGGYFIIAAMNRWGIGFMPSLILGFLATGLVSIVFERLLYSRLYKAAELYQVLLTIGLILAMIAGITLVEGPSAMQRELPPSLRGQLDLGFVSYPTYRLLLIAIGAALMVALWLGFERTQFGAKIRAAVDNRRMAESLGINVNLLFTVTFAIGSGLAAIGGGLGAEVIGLDPQYPLKYLPFFLIIVAIGGQGRITGVFIAALAIGISEFALKVWFPKGHSFFIYAFTIVFLLVRPQGLFGKK